MGLLQDFRRALGTPAMRTRLIACALALGIFAALPAPQSGAPLAWNLIVGGLWLCLAALAWASALAEDLVRVFWFAAFVLSVVAFLRLRYLLPLVLIASWGLWFQIRSQRELKKLVLFALLLGTSPSLWAMAKAKPLSSSATATLSPMAGESHSANPPAGAVNIPKYLTGYQINDITSCGAIDQIPWRFKPDGRKVRLIMKDELRHQSETHTSPWEVYQVMDKDGFVSFVFRRALADGRYDAIVAKDSVYNRIIDTPKGPKTIEVQDLRTLINRPAITFYHTDGSTVTFSPSSVGRSALIIQLSSKDGGRLLPPVFLRGNICDRPEDEENSDTLNKKLQAETTPGGQTVPASGGK
jgi:hypothetical protein